MILLGKLLLFGENEILFCTYQYFLSLVVSIHKNQRPEKCKMFVGGYHSKMRPFRVKCGGQSRESYVINECFFSHQLIPI